MDEQNSSRTLVSWPSSDGENSLPRPVVRSILVFSLLKMVRIVFANMHLIIQKYA